MRLRHTSTANPFLSIPANAMYGRAAVLAKSLDAPLEYTYCALLNRASREVQDCPRIPVTLAGSWYHGLFEATEAVPGHGCTVRYTPVDENCASAVAKMMTTDEVQRGILVPATTPDFILREDPSTPNEDYDVTFSTKSVDLPIRVLKRREEWLYEQMPSVAASMWANPSWHLSDMVDFVAQTSSLLNGNTKVTSRALEAAFAFAAWQLKVSSWIEMKRPDSRVIKRMVLAMTGLVPAKQAVLEP